MEVKGIIKDDFGCRESCLVWYNVLKELPYKDLAQIFMMHHIIKNKITKILFK